ncbi:MULTISPECIES: Lrp/AsnC family transcriptional regulator [Roseobacteraceae]|uniref:Lrp/AsnC family transcriptional regulator n=1 Tax=Falsiruegeria litorea TaxID=1280831 RepID=A0ABS5WXN6_9RHOB|nr:MULTISPECIES: Lrp/AsnC family transcriptional regulator [Roseobacteraceae]MBT3143884.1 Lrp/AsnC family transcriptional regulator [Falsiruegeria litorea]MBT8168858.1 Lrp/AsnC family transcriptional regulator [Falsiruegeria litorea]RBW59085.1 AsnC family transcriptional regulator [Ruegeria sp. A3M17]
MSDVLDRIDHKILRELQKDARLSHQDLSDRIGLSPSPCARRIRKLEADGYITGYSAVIDEDKLGFGFSVFVSVRLDRQVDDRLVSFEEELCRFPEVVDCWLMTGSFDYLIRIAVQDLNEFERFLTGRLTKLDGVASIESSIPIRRVKFLPARLD